MTIAQKVQEFFWGRRLNEKGDEVPDPRPVALPLGYSHPEPLEVRMARMIRQELSQEAARRGAETFEEANDFDVNDPDDVIFPDEDDKFTVNDPNLRSAFEREEPVVRERLTKAQRKAAEEKKKAKAKPAPAGDDGDAGDEPE